MVLVLLLWSLLVISVGGQQADWVDPYDPFDYHSTSTPESQHVSTKRREYVDEDTQLQLSQCTGQVAGLQKKIEEQRKTISVLLEQPSCNPVFKRFLSRLLKEMQKVGLPADSSNAVFDAKVQISTQATKEIQALLDGEENWRTGGLDDAISQILVNFKLHDYDAWKWRFEDTFGVELDTLLKMLGCVLIIITIICTQLWSTVSWFVQFGRLFAVCFLISLVWNWFYLYKIAFAEHQSNLMKMHSFNEKCTGVKKVNWIDSLKEWYRSTLTLQDDPCKTYYEVLMVDPILLVPPTKAFSVTITTFFTEPLKHIGQGISEFLRALLQDLPVTMQIPVFLTIVLAIVVVLYVSVQSAFQHGITAPLRRRRGPPAPGVQQPQRPALTGRGNSAAGNAQPQQGPKRQADTSQVRQRNPNAPAANQTPVVTETLRAAAGTRDEPDTERQEGGGAGAEMMTPEVGEGTQVKKEGEKTEEPAAAADPSPVKTKMAAKVKRIRVYENRSHDEPWSEAEPAAGQDDVKVPKASPEQRTTSAYQTNVETLGAPPQPCSDPGE